MASQTERTLGFTGRLARASVRRRKLVVGAWVVMLVAGMALASQIASVLSTSQDFAGGSKPESVVALDLLEERLRGPMPMVEYVIVNSESMTVDDPAFEARVTSLLGDIRGLEGEVVQATSYYETGLPQLVSQDRTATLIPVTLVGDLDEAQKSVLPLLALLERENGSGFELLTNGFASVNEAFTHAAESDASAEMRALPAATVIVILVFGALVAALVPLLLAFFSIVIAMGLAMLVGQVFSLSIFVTNMILMIGLAVGIDYALFIVERFREERRGGRAVDDAVAIAGDTASRAVLFSGLTVMIALAGMFIVPVSVFRSLGAGAILVVLTAVAASMTLLPAILSLLGDRVNRLTVPFIGRRRGTSEDRGFWAGAARVVMKNPIPAVLLSGGLLVALSISYFDIQLGSAGASSLPTGTDARRAYEVMDEKFNAGVSLPTEIVVDAPDVASPAVSGAIEALVAAIRADGSGIFGEPQVQTNGAGDLALVEVALDADGSSQAALDAVALLREDLVPAAFEGVDAAVYVGGMTAGNADFFALVDRYTPIVFAFVLSFSFLLLLLAFRSLVVPAKAIVMNLLSVGATYGTLVLVFQKGYLTGLLGFQQVDRIEAWIPLFLFTILFGLSMDYHVFLLSRIRERFDQTHDNAGSVAFGLRSTANIITGAAAIMIAVFGGFAMGDLVMFQQMGFGLAVAVFLDATVVRTVLVPASMELLGDRNWYLPKWLEWLPDLRVEGAPPFEPAAGPAVAERVAESVPAGGGGGA